MKILVVEDNPKLARFLVRALAEEGWVDVHHVGTPLTHDLDGLDAAPHRASPRRPRRQGELDLLACQLAASGHQPHLVLPDRKLPALLHLGALGVSQVVQTGDEILLREVLTAPELDRPAVDTRQRPFALAVQPDVDQAREADVGDDEAEKAQADADAQADDGPLLDASAPGPFALGSCRRGRLARGG